MNLASRTSGDAANGAFSPAVSLILTPTARLTAYLTYASSVEQGDEAPAGTANVNQFLSPCHDELYEGGVGDVRYYSSIGVGNISGAAGANTAYLGTPRTVLGSLEIDL